MFSNLEEDQTDIVELAGFFEFNVPTFNTLTCYQQVVHNSAHFFRVSYTIGLFSVHTNAYYLKFPQTTLSSSLSEIIYLFHEPNNPNDPMYEIRRCVCQVVPRNGSLWIENEIVLSKIDAKCMGRILALFNELVNSEKLNLTTLRKIASKKESKKKIEVLLNEVKHQLEVKIYLQTVLVSYSQIDNTSNFMLSIDYLAKCDILAFASFLKLTLVLLEEKIEQKSDFELMFSPVMKLTNIGNRLLLHRNATRMKHKDKMLVHKDA